MKYGQIAGNSSINKLIYQCFEIIGSQTEELKFVKKFRELSSDSDEIMHTFRELVLGAYLRENGFCSSYEHQIAGKTPDWSILNGDENVLAVIELVNFHIDNETEKGIELQVQTKGFAGYRRDGNKDNIDRLYSSLSNKAQVYRDIVKNLNLPYVIGLHGDFRVALDLDEVKECLFGEEFGIFQTYPELSGLIYVQDLVFSYLANPKALHAIDLPSGVFISPSN